MRNKYMHFSNHSKTLHKTRRIHVLTLLSILTIFSLILIISQQNHNLRTNVIAAPPQQNQPGVGASPGAQNVFWVYGGPLVGDQPAAGWGNNTSYGGGSTVNLTNTSPVYNGIHSISYLSLIHISEPTRRT